jgi:lipid-A-disaccharide synthase
MQGNIDLMLTLFPFEVDFYKKHHIKAQFVGHPLADEIPLNSNQFAARKTLNLPQDKKILAILPGSRAGEIKRLSPAFLEAAAQLQRKYSNLYLISPMVNSKIRQQFTQIHNTVAPTLTIHLIKGQSRQVMTAADILLMASGTAVLEGMLVGKPMLAAYKVSATTAAIIRTFRMIKAPYFTLPNNLAGERLVPELIQEAVTVNNIVKELETLFTPIDDNNTYRQQRFNEIHQQLAINASQTAAQAIISFYQELQQTMTN